MNTTNCRDDGRCEYAIEHGAEGLGACPPGKCCMPRDAGGQDAISLMQAREPQKTYTGPERRVKPRMIEIDLTVLRASLKREIEGDPK